MSEARLMVRSVRRRPQEMGLQMSELLEFIQIDTWGRHACQRQIIDVVDAHISH